jgi:predicted AlkP superfamily phosphohydrolase/phosphomutase
VDRYGKNSVLLNIPLTYPPEKILGVIVSGMLTPSEDSDFTQPKQLKKKLLRMGYRIGIGSLLHLLYLKDKEALLKELNNITKIRGEVALWLWKKLQPDFLMVVFMNSDRIQHFFWKYHNAEGEYTDAILKHYQLLDNLLGNFMEKKTKETTIIIMSDHGFGPMRKEFYINNYLRKLGLLETKANRQTRYLRKFGLRWEVFPQMFVKLPRFIQNLIANTSLFQLFCAIENKVLAMTTNTLSNIDFSKTKAYCPIDRYIKINVRGRDSQGIIELNEEDEAFQNYLIQKLYTLKDPKDETPVIKKVYKREEIFWGPYIHEAPDLLIHMREDYVMVEKFTEDDKLFGTPMEWLSEISGGHRSEGLFIMSGPNVRKGITLGDLDIWDVMPNALYSLGLPIPSDIDGKLLTEAFTKSYITSFPPKIEDISTEKIQGTISELSKEENEEVLKRLRALGYIS